MKDKTFKINSLSGLVAAMRRANFVAYLITNKDEIFVTLRFL